MHIYGCSIFIKKEVKPCCFRASGHLTLPGQISCKWIQLVTGGVENKIGSVQRDDDDIILAMQYVFTSLQRD